jgi:BirA family biotin operon repressor/biotin-[acetyl-CoA-carboxylase] ligase
VDETPRRAPLPTDAASWAGLSAPWRAVEVVDDVASTNEALAARAEAGEEAGLVLVAETQTAGRGRLGRTWTSPPRSGLTVSFLLRPEVPAARLGWLPLLTGLAVAEAVAEQTGVEARVKWPNDVVVGEPVRKLGGLLSERRGDAVVVGLGLNVSLTLAELPVENATSLLLEGTRVGDRHVLLRHLLDVLGARYRQWVEADGDADACGLRAAYAVRCVTVGRDVRVELPGGETLEGQAVGVDADGCLRVAETQADGGPGEVRAVAAGDVVHVR